MLRELQALQDLVTLDPTKDEKFRAKLLENLDCKESTLTSDEKAIIEELLMEFHDIFARHRFDVGMKEEFKVKPSANKPEGGHSCRTSYVTQIWTSHYSTIFEVC